MKENQLLLLFYEPGFGNSERVENPSNLVPFSAESDTATTAWS